MKYSPFLKLACLALLTTPAWAELSPRVQEALDTADGRFVPAVQSAFLEDAKAAALKKIAASGKSLPADFLAWIDGDVIVKTTVYGARQDPSGVLLMLRSLEIDLGREAVREKYTQLALAMAVTRAAEGQNADLAPRAPLTLSIGGDPRKIVNTRDPNRTLDVYDHVINFLNDHAPIEEEVVVGQKEVLPELVYDVNGVAIPQKGKPKKVPITEKRLRPLRAADVIASAALEKEFNDYMKAHGQTVQIRCGDGARLHWKSTDAKGIDGPGTKAAFEFFTKAYEAKGYMPPQRDAAPTPAQSLLFWIRNHESKPADAKIAWPRYPINAPWPTMTFLAHDNQPLRERDDIWMRYRDKGEFHGYGEYVGPIAQNNTFLAARRVAPYAFSYGSVQMMLKDGGVCGVMANIAVRSHQSLGTPASTAGQPGHCALVRFTQEKDGTFRCVGGQYATAGDAGTHVHVPWSFGEVNARRPMIYHQSVAYGVNFGLQSYLDSTVAHTIYQQLAPAERKTRGAALLQSAAALNPYNFLIVDDALESEQPAQIVEFWQKFKPLLASGKPGCPADGLYNQTIKDKLFARLAALPVPADAAQAQGVFAFLQSEKCDNPATLANYKLALNGLPALLDETAAAFKTHLASTRSDASCEQMAKSLEAAAGKITDKKARAAWALLRWQELQGQELYLGRKNAFTADASLKTLGKLAAQKPRDGKAQTQSLLERLAAQFKNELPGRTPQSAKNFAGVISAVAAQITDADQKRQWLESLSQAIAGQETFTGPKGKPQRDPAADLIANLLKPAAN